VSDTISQSDLLRFAYGEADELEDAILGDPEYLDALEEIWAAELPHDLRTTVVRALQFEQLASRTLGAVLDLGMSFGAAVPHYMTVSLEEDDTAGER
jgi:hypothetical protein